MCIYYFPLCSLLFFFFFFFNDTATTEIYTLSYTTLFRSRAADDRLYPCLGLEACDPPSRRQLSAAGIRSEEHTSELQSLRHLVCRLLLEKKKKKTSNRVV